MSNQKWSAYKHTNKINGKCYIGITSKTVEQRWENGLGYKKCPHFYNAIKKYGWDSFTHEVLYNDLTKEEANSTEIRLIHYYKSNDPKFGYNVSSGGAGSTGVKASERTKKIMSANNSGENNPMYGKHHSEKTKEKMHSFKIGKPLSEEHKRKLSEAKNGHNCGEKCVLCIELDLVFHSVRSAANTFGISETHISACCKGKRNLCGGYHWNYYNDSTLDVA